MAISYTEHKKEHPRIRNPAGFLQSQHPSQAAESPPFKESRFSLQKRAVADPRPTLGLQVKGQIWRRDQPG